MSDGYQGLPKSDKWGCIGGALVGVPVFLFLLGLDALGDCAPDPGCRHGFWLMVALPSLTVTALTFWMIRDWMKRRGRDDT